MFFTPPQLNSNLITMNSYGSELNYEDVATFLPSSHQEKNLIKFISLSFADKFCGFVFPADVFPEIGSQMINALL